MKYLTHPTHAAALARTARAFADGTAAGLFPHGTTAYAEPVKHPHRTEWAVPVDARYAALFTAAEHAAATVLPPDWHAHGRIGGTFAVDTPLSAYKPDPAVTRRASCNLPVVVADREKTFVLEVVVRHYRGAVHVWEELADRRVTLTADNTDGEYDALYGAVAGGANILTLIAANIALRDSQGRFD